MSLFRLQITAPHRTIWRDSATLETLNLGDAVRIADKIATACRQPNALNRDATRNWVVEVISEVGQIFHAAPVTGSASPRGA